MTDIDQDTRLAVLTAEIEWYREKVTHVAAALDGLGKRAAAAGKYSLAEAYYLAAQLTLTINEVER